MNFTNEPMCLIKSIPSHLIHPSITLSLNSICLLPPSNHRLDPDKTRHKTPRHLLLDLELCAPTRTMSRYQNFDIESFQRLHGGVEVCGLGVGEVVAAYYCVEGEGM